MDTFSERLRAAIAATPPLTCHIPDRVALKTIQAWGACWDAAEWAAMFETLDAVDPDQALTDLVDVWNDGCRAYMFDRIVWVSTRVLEPIHLAAILRGVIARQVVDLYPPFAPFADYLPDRNVGARVFSLWKCPDLGDSAYTVWFIVREMLTGRDDLDSLIDYNIQVANYLAHRASADQSPDDRDKAGWIARREMRNELVTLLAACLRAGYAHQATEPAPAREDDNAELPF